MIRAIGDFLDGWRAESDATLSIFGALTDASLAQKVAPEGRSLGQIAWHMTLSLGEMMAHAGSPIPWPGEDAPVPSTAEAIRRTYADGSAALLADVRGRWTDAKLLEEVAMYGEKWAYGKVLSVLIVHQAHHRGQMTVLMRQAGLRVPGVYGPSREEWQDYNMPAPW